MKKEDNDSLFERRNGSQTITYFRDNINDHHWNSFKGEHWESDQEDLESFQKLNFSEINKQKATDLINLQKVSKLEKFIMDFKPVRPKELSRQFEEF